jgi:hypothetical protein
LSRDYRNCLACGVECAADQFCGNAGCRPAVIASVCDSANVTFLLDGLSVDEATVPTLSAGIVAGCSPTPAVRSVTQAVAGTINAITGRPVVGSGDIQVVVGGPYGQRLIRYLEATGVTAVYNTYDGSTAQYNVRGANGGAPTVVVNATAAALTDGHSYFVIEMVPDPSTGTLAFALYGFTSPGTVAATYYFLNEMLPARATFDKSYYVYEWTNVDADLQPSSADTFHLVASGP